MRTTFRTALPVALILALAPAAARAQKIGVVDTQRAAEEIDEGKAATALLKKDFAEKQKQIDQRKADLDRLQADYEKQASVLTDATKREKAADIDRRARELQGLFVQLNKDLQERERAVTAPIFEKMQAIIREIAQAEGLSVVLSAQTVVFAQPSLDITNELVRKYNARHPAAGGAAAAKKAEPKPAKAAKK